MTTQVGEIEVAVVAKLDKLERDLKSLQGKLNQTAKKADKPLSKIKKAFAGMASSGVAKMGTLVVAFASVGKVMRDMVTNAKDDELAFVRLNAALGKVVPNSMSVTKELYAQAEAFDRLSTSSQTQIVDAQTFMTNMGVMPDQMELATSAALNMAAAMGWDLTTAARNAGKTMGGFAGELGEVIPELKNLTAAEMQAGAALELLNEKFGGQFQSQMETFAGRSKDLGDAWEVFTANTGKAITQSPHIVEAMEKLNESLRAPSSSASIIGVMEFITNWGGKGLSLLNKAGDFLSMGGDTHGIKEQMAMLKEMRLESEKLDAQWDEDNLHALLTGEGGAPLQGPILPPSMRPKGARGTGLSEKEVAKQEKFLMQLEKAWASHFDNKKKLSEIERDAQIKTAEKEITDKEALKEALFQIEMMHIGRLTEIKNEHSDAVVEFERDMTNQILSIKEDEIGLAKESHEERLRQVNELTNVESERIQLRRASEQLLEADLAEIDEKKLDLAKSIHQELLGLQGNENALAVIAHEDRLQEIIDEGLAHGDAAVARLQSAEILSLKLKEIEEDRLEAQKGEWDGFTDYITDSFENAIADMIMTGEVGFAELGQAFLREFIQRGVAAGMDSVFGGAGGGGSIWDGISSALGLISGFNFGGGGGSAASYGSARTASFPEGNSVAIPRWASGGPMNAGQIGLVGERGPELFRPRSSGTIIPNHALGGGGGGGDVFVSVVNNTGEKSETRETSNADGTRQIEVMIGKAVATNIHRGGTIDSALRSSYGLKRPGRHS